MKKVNCYLVRLEMYESSVGLNSISIVIWELAYWTPVF
jgi:hypothetical protein